MTNTPRHLLRQSPIHDRKRVRLVIVVDHVPGSLNGGDNLGLAGIALPRRMSFDRSYGDALVGNTVMLTRPACSPLLAERCTMPLPHRGHAGDTTLVGCAVPLKDV